MGLRGPAREWGSLDGSEPWTQKKAQAHLSYARRRGLENLSWALYLRLKAEGEVIRQQKSTERLAGLDPSKIRMGGRKVLMRPASEIVAKILAKAAE